ncbi:MAG: P-loop NTPase [Oscillospiraceae bacterium]|nr:P-loop NTPase [Oscillospiraceae bacterium]
MDEQMIHLDEINLIRLAKDLLYNLWVAVLLAAAVWMGISAYEKLNYEPMYTSSATLVVSAKGGSGAYSSLSLTSNMAEVFSQVFRSNVLLEKVEEQMGEPLSGYINPTTIPNTNLMVLSLTSTSPEQAFRALDLVIETYPEIAESMFGNAVLTVLKEPAVPRTPSNTRDMASVQKLGAVAAFAVAMLLIAALSVLRETVQTPVAAKRRVDGRLLRSVRHEVKNKTFRAIKKKKNIAPLITSPFISTGFKEDNQSLCSKMEYHMRKRDQKVILVSSAGENEGKSTVAANLALGLTGKDKKVALLDCDFRKPAVYKIFETNPGEGQEFGKYLTQEDASPDFLVPLKKFGIWVGLNTVGYKYPQRLITSPKMEQCLQQLRQEFDYVVLDSPPMLVAADTEALAALADVAVLVAREDFVRTRDINDCLDALRRSCPDVAGFVLNNCLDTGK